MRSSLKEAVINPKLKKDSLDPREYSNFRPISNIKFVSKMIEKAVLFQLKEHMEYNNLEESLQSAYKRYHSTETALVKMHNDIIHVTDNKCFVILSLLGDTPKHSSGLSITAILLSRMFTQFCYHYVKLFS